MTREEKQETVEVLRLRYAAQYYDVAAIEPRMTEYFDGLTASPDYHNGYELLGAVKFLRLLRTYDFDHKKVRKVIWLREGNWHQEADGRWVHDSDGLKCPGTDTAHVYRWRSFQVFVLASVFGFQSWVNTHVRAIDKPELLRTERVREDGFIEDLRRVCNYFVCFFPRKADKTGLSAYIQLLFFLLEDFDAECFCCAMSEQQAKILFNRTKFMLKQLNQGQWRMTEKVVDWKPQFQQVRNSSITPLTAGGKAKDGAFAALVNWDEFGSSPYVNSRSDMAGLINVMRSSMGPRRNPLTFGTTTAGTISQGPFIEMLDGLHHDLMRELDYETGKDTPTYSGDRSLCLLYEPDDFEKHDEQLILTSPDIRMKVQPMMGVTVQHQFYDDSIEEMRTGKMTRGEVLAKLFNVYSTGRVTQWMKGDRIRPLQRDFRIDDCRYMDEQGRVRWQVFCGMDFASRDDFFAVTYLAVDYRPSDTMEGRFRVDTDCYLLESALEESPNRALYEEWARQGWLHIIPGEVFDSNYAIDRIAELTRKGVNILSFAYDPAQSREPINQLKAWLQTLFGQREGTSPHDIAQLIDRMVLPASQTSYAMNPIVQHLEDMILRCWMHFSPNPSIPWQVNNTAIEVNSSDLRRLCKGGKHHEKMDFVAALCDAVYAFDLAEGNIDSGK